MKAIWKIETMEDLESYHNIYRIRWYDWIFHPIRSYRKNRTERVLTKMMSDIIREEIDREILTQISNSEYFGNKMNSRDSSDLQTEH